MPENPGFHKLWKTLNSPGFEAELVAWDELAPYAALHEFVWGDPFPLAGRPSEVLWVSMCHGDQNACCHWYFDKPSGRFVFDIDFYNRGGKLMPCPYRSELS